jgi:hypothetical protein
MKVQGKVTEVAVPLRGVTKLGMFLSVVTHIGDLCTVEEFP